MHLQQVHPPTTSRIVVFQEDVDSITLNTDIIASLLVEMAEQISLMLH